VRDDAAQQGLSDEEALQKGMRKSVEFVKQGAEVYRKVWGSSNILCHLYAKKWLDGNIVNELSELSLK
jgi:hypothetical protein